MGGSNSNEWPFWDRGIEWEPRRQLLNMLTVSLYLKKHKSIIRLLRILRQQSQSIKS